MDGDDEGVGNFRGRKREGMKGERLRRRERGEEGEGNRAAR